MRKILIFIIIMTITFPIQSAVTTETCANRAGILVVGNNEIQYCMSRISMNWWTAIGWCQSIGMRPFNYSKDCSCTGENCPISPCPNIAFNHNNYYLWSGTSKGSTAITFPTITGAVANYSNKTAAWPSLCAPK